MSLSEALACLERSDQDGALLALLDAWRALPAPAVAALIDELSGTITARRPPVTATGKLSAKKMWDQLAEAKDPLDLGRLLAVLPDGNDRGLRIAALVSWERDPRVATAAMEWLLRPPVVGARRRSFFVPMARLLSKHRDPRLSQILRVMTSKDERSTTIQRLGLPAWKPFVALAAELDEPMPFVSPDDEALIARVRERLARPAPEVVDPEELFARVYEHPEDDQARAVLGDLLQQLGDPRGEFIALQLARKAGERRSSRERALEETWGRKWLGPLDEALAKGDVVFERGFLARGRYLGGFAGGATAGAREWATVTHLDCSAASQYVTYSHRTVLDPVMRSLRHVVGLSREDFGEILRARPLPWETVGLRAHRFSDAGPLRHGPGEVLRAVRTLVVLPAYGDVVVDQTPEEAGALVESWPSIERYETGVRHDHIAAFAASLRSTPLVGFVAHTPNFVAELGMKSRVLELRLETLKEWVAELLAEVIRGLSQAGLVSRVRLELPSKTQRDGDELSRGKFARMSLSRVREACQEVPLEIV